jgi:hypothetical protein
MPSGAAALTSSAHLYSVSYFSLSSVREQQRLETHLAAVNIRHFAQSDDPYPPFTLISEPTELARLIDGPSSSDDSLILRSEEELAYEAEPKTPARPLARISDCNDRVHLIELTVTSAVTIQTAFSGQTTASRRCWPRPYPPACYMLVRYGKTHWLKILDHPLSLVELVRASPCAPTWYVWSGLQQAVIVKLPSREGWERLAGVTTCASCQLW